MILRAALIGGFLLSSPAWAAGADIAPVALNSLSAPPHNLVGAPVLDQRGHLLGKVAQVQTDAAGRPDALAFKAITGQQLVVVSAAAASFDGAQVVADDSQPQIAALDTVRTASNAPGR